MEELKQLLENQGYAYLNEVPGRGICGLRKFLFTIAIVSDLDESGYKGRWCYATMPEAAVALSVWNGEGDPSGNWIKYKGHGGERENQNRQTP